MNIIKVTPQEELCDLCAKTFQNKNQLKTHKKISLDDRQFTCEEPNCGAVFIGKRSFDLHKRSHDKTPCPHCGKIFTKQNIPRHKKS